MSMQSPFNGPLGGDPFLYKPSDAATVHHLDGREIPPQKLYNLAQEKVNGLYSKLLGREKPPTPEESGIWVRMMLDHPDGDERVVNGIKNSPEYKLKNPPPTITERLNSMRNIGAPLGR